MQLRFGTLSGTNDPKESFGISPEIEISHEGLFVERYKNFELPNVERSDRSILNIEDISKRYGLLCFSQSNKNIKSVFDYGFAKPRMWAQYGEGHIGACLVINKTKFTELFTAINDRFKIHKRIMYNLNDENTCYKLCLTQSNIDNNTYNEINAKLFRKNINNILFRKSKDWKEENEYRFLLDLMGKKEFYISIKDCLEAIILSGNNHDKLKSYIISKSKQYDFKVYKLNLANGIPNVTSLTLISMRHNIGELLSQLKNQLSNQLNINNEDSLTKILDTKESKLNELEIYSDLLEIVRSYNRNIYSDNEDVLQKLSFLISSIQSLIQKLDKIREINNLKDNLQTNEDFRQSIIDDYNNDMYDQYQSDFLMN